MLAGGNARLLEAARCRGLTTSLDINWDPQWNSAPEAAVRARKEAVRRLLPLVDLVHGNVRELCLFTDSGDLTAALNRLTAWGAGAVVIHMGKEGAGYFSRGELFTEPAAPVRQHVNSTGCGDLLSVCIMLLHDRQDIPMHEKLRLANRIVAEYIEGRRTLGGTLDDSLVDELLTSSSRFQALVTNSKAGRRKPFSPGNQGPAGT
jgi:2-dehydro-3-deoxygluconokinase